MDDLGFISREAFEAHLCKKPLGRVIDGKPMTFLCLLRRGHEGRCKEALAVFKKPDERKTR